MTAGAEASRSECADGCHYATHMRGGTPISVRICMLCKSIDFDDLATQAGIIEQDIRADERRRICAQEGHAELETTLGAVDRHFRCRRCGLNSTRPRETA